MSATSVSRPFKVTARVVLELGAELISSDMIAFYELIKNAFDAGSSSGAEVHFRVVLRRNDYLQILASAREFSPGTESSPANAGGELERLEALKTEVHGKLDPAAGRGRVEEFMKFISSSNALAEFAAQFEEAYRSLNTIEIRDTGSGMSANELIDNYLTIGTPSRKRKVDEAIAAGEVKSPFLGEKGIGRLSAMRLGDRLRLETARREDAHLQLLDIDWKRFTDLDAMLEDIHLAPVRGPRKEKTDWSGTRVVIGDLAEDWSEARVRHFAENEFARVTDPFGDPKKRPRIALLWNDSRIAIPWMDRTLIANAHASVRGHYEIIGGLPQLQISLEARNLGYPHPLVKDSISYTMPDLAGLLADDAVPMHALTSVGPFSFEIYWYNRRLLREIENIGNQEAVRKLQRKWSGILLFRDGFRVFPYGEVEDDWLGLDQRALGRTGYALNKNQFVGHVQITRTANPGLVDQTNREGL